MVDAVFSLTLTCFAKVICVLRTQLISGLGLLIKLPGLPLFSLLEKFTVYLYFKMCSSFCDRLRFSYLCFHFLLVFENLGILIHKSLVFPWLPVSCFCIASQVFLGFSFCFHFSMRLTMKLSTFLSIALLCYSTI